MRARRGIAPPAAGRAAEQAAVEQAAAEAVPGAGFLNAAEILDTVETAVIVVDHWGKLRYANAHAVALYGYQSIDHLVSVEFRELGFDAEDMGKVNDLERHACAGHDWEGSVHVRRPDGAKFYLKMTASALRSPSGEVTGTVIMARQAVQLGMKAGFEKLGLLDTIGNRLGTTLDFNETLRSVAELLVPQFADHCFIDLYKKTDSGQDAHLIRQVKMSARDRSPAQGSWYEVGDIVRYPLRHFCRTAIEKNEVQLIEHVEFDAYPSPSEQSLEASKNAGLTSVMAAPLFTRGERLGVISLALSRRGPDREVQHYGQDDRDIFAAIASRIAIALDNAMLFQEERNTAVAFQNSLLPPRTPPVLDGLEVAYSYVPAKPLEDRGQGIQTQVGGDWYDIIQLSAGRIGIVIGDVEGRGARAAAIMGQIRSALRAFAQDDKAPADILRRLDDWCRSMKDTPDSVDWPIVSCTYLIYDPWSRRLTIANAGHMPPVLVSGEDMQPMEIETGVLLGVRGTFPGLPPYREEVRDLPPGSTLLFYTDGLVDRREKADGTGKYTDGEVLALLDAAIKAVAHESVQQIVAAAEGAVPGEIDDDMAILAVRTSMENLPGWEMKLPAEAIKVSEARRMAFDTFVACGMDDEQADLACLLVSEVVTNVVLHTVGPAVRHDLGFDRVGSNGARSALEDWLDSPYSEEFGSPHGAADPAGSRDFTLRIRKGNSAVWVEVQDTDLRLPRIRMAGENDEGGRGLYLVDQLAERWGSRPTEDGKAVWFEMSIRSVPVGALPARGDARGGL